MRWSRFRSRHVILLYHRVARLSLDPWEMAVTPEHFTEHLEVLRRFRPVPLNRFEPSARPLRGLSFSITFDDGYADNLLNAAPALERVGFPATFFITTGYVGTEQEFWWDELERIVYSDGEDRESRDRTYLDLYNRLQPLAHDARRRELDALSAECGACAAPRRSHRILNRDELRTLDSHKLFEIGAHTVTHPLLAAQSEAMQSAEIIESKVWLERALEHPVTSFSYPYGGRGHYSDATVRSVREAGFQRACTTEGRAVDTSSPRHEWGRVNVTDMSGEQFETALWG